MGSQVRQNDRNLSHQVCCQPISCYTLLQEPITSCTCYQCLFPVAPVTRACLPLHLLQGPVSRCTFCTRDMGLDGCLPRLDDVSRDRAIFADVHNTCRDGKCIDFMNSDNSPEALVWLNIETVEVMQMLAPRN